MGDKKIREPIISVLGHVDHGKTTLLDWIRGSVVASREQGGITQHIGATDVPFKAVEKICGPLLSKLKIRTEIRGLLFIDTPGHEAFTNLRKRGGSVADLAVLVVDLNDGLMPQSLEAVDILKGYRVPFIIAANKIDNIRGWKTGLPLTQQMQHVQDEFYKHFYDMIGQLSMLNINADLYSNIKDFTKQIAIVPVSAKKGDGIPELLMVLMGLSQQYLKDKLTIEADSPGKGTILEVKEERGLGTTIDVILYDGVLKKTDTIVVGSREPVVTTIKAILKPKELDEIRDPRDRFMDVDEVVAAAGVKISAPNLDKAMAGTPVYVGGEELVGKMTSELEDVEIETDKSGVIIKADTVGSLEALISILCSEGVPIKRGTIGKVSNADIMEASAVGREDRFLGVVLSFNSPVLRDAGKLAQDNQVPVFRGGVIYKLLEDYKDWVRAEKQKERRDKERRTVSPGKIKVMPGYVFRQSKPAIVGVKVLAGKLSTNSRLMNDDCKVVGWVKSIQLEKDSIPCAQEGQEVAVSIEGAVMGRNLDEGDVLYTFISGRDVRQLLSDEELPETERILVKEIRDIKKHNV
ncbi:MAG: translation initiation factor IF-2 [Candidatus Altiarchaeales archaeon ex4484_2]|nr:MAG: translation initiation factor IF-2 [Candidatus Altiarchaeales archaeon ex4484_2]